MGIVGVNHIAFRTADAGRLSDFYAELLAADPVHDDLGAYWLE
jgi:hypothetical protein